MVLLLEILAIVTTPTVEAGKRLLGTIECQASYLIHWDKNIGTLKIEVVRLEKKRNEVEQWVNIARRKSEAIYDTVEEWLTRVDGIIAHMRTPDDQVMANVRCFDLSIRYKLGKEAKRKIDIVSGLQTEGGNFNFNNVSYPKPNPGIESLPDGDFSSFESTEFAMKQVMDALKNEKFNIIGVYGMGGVGKTTLVNQVAKKVKSEGLFKDVAIVTLPRNPDLKQLQIEIAEQLDMRLENENESMRARKLAERLNEAKSVLVILDNLWERLELANVGIPHGERKGCKIIFTTRSTDICNVMKSQAKIPVNILSEKDSWSLFKENAGDVVDRFASHDLPRKVANECGRLPLAIVTLGRALRDKEETIWANALLELKRSNPANIMDMNDKVFASLELSYKYLKSDEAKSCFLFCSMYPEGHSISIIDLIRYGMGEGLFHDVNTLEEASGRVYTLIDILKASCLLLEGNGDMWVKIHDVVRDVVISIASRHEDSFFVKAAARLQEWPEIKNLEECKRIALAYNNFEVLPDAIACPQLLTLLLRENRSLENISKNFFIGMKALRVLDLSGTNISLLPSSLECLENLRTLWLARCPELRDVALIGRLKKLEILCLEESGVNKLPEEIGELTSLKLLDLSNTKLETIPPNVISRLIRLEELYMGHTFSQWEPKGPQDARQASIAEIESLTRLSVLEIHVGNINCMSERDISGSWKNLKKFKICIGGDYRYRKTQRFIKLEEMSIPFPNLIKFLCDITAELHLVNCKGLTNIANTQEIRGEYLEFLTIEKCGEMEHVICMEEDAPASEFRSLKRLALVHLENLKKICNGPVAAAFLKNLKVLEVSNCNNLINILSSHLVQELSNLETLVVVDCQELQEVVNSDGLEEEHALLTKLREVQLKHLPKLSSVWKGAIPIGSLHNLEKLIVENCNLRYLFSPTLAQCAANLRELRIHACWKMEKLIMEEICPSQLLLPTRCFQNLQLLDIAGCHGFKSLCSSTLARDLACLEYLSVHICDGMEMIITKEDGVAADMDVLPQLKILALLYLPNLTGFYEEARILKFFSLKRLRFMNCPQIKWLPLGPQSAPNLDEVVSSNWRELEELEWNDESVKLRLQNLFEECELQKLSLTEVSCCRATKF